MNTGFSIIICTRNRYDLLIEAVKSLIPQISGRNDVELIIVDNDSTDNTGKIIAEHPEFNLGNTFLIAEKKIGLSYARNTGAKQANFDWVCYMDDDAKASADFVKVMFSTREAYNFDAFGGMFYPWYYTEKPKWLPNEVGTMHKYSDKIVVLNDKQFVAGGICAFNKKLLLDVGGFPTHIGMRGDIVGYGEENYLQIQLRSKGATIGFNPNWTILHLVGIYKYSLKWNLTRYYSKGRDSGAYLEKLTFLTKTKIAAKATAMPFLLAIKYFPKLLFNKNYLWQNWILDSLKYTLRMFGRLSYQYEK